MVIVLPTVHLLGDLDLEGGVGVSEVSLEVFDSLVSTVETVLAAVAVPVGTFEPLLPFNGTNYFTVVAASKHFKATKVNAFVKMLGTKVSS